MLRVLLAKDLRRAWRNPVPWLVNLIVPLVLTALLGLVFGGSSENSALTRIRFAVVDEDQSVLSDILRGAVTQNQGGKYLEPVFMERDAAMKLINANKISAVLIIHTNFMRDYLTARKPVSLELIKNPAESIHPAVLEELLGAVTTALSEISRNFNSEFPDWQRVLAGKDDYHKVSFLIDRAGDKLKSARNLLHPPLVSYEKDGGGGEATATAAGAGISNHSGTNRATGAMDKPAPKPKSSDMANVFRYLLLGLSAMFLLFLGQNGMNDLHRELRKRTFERYQTLHQQVWPFIFGKIIFTVVMLLICSAVMLGGGGLAFQIHWQNPGTIFALVLGYSCFVAALFAVLVALVPDERRAGALNNVVSLALGMVGGCAFPPENLPGFLRDHVTPMMPSYWFVVAARNAAGGAGDGQWELALLKLVIGSVILAVLAAWLLRRRFITGVRA